MYIETIRKGNLRLRLVYLSKIDLFAQRNIILIILMVLRLKEIVIALLLFILIPVFVYPFSFLAKLCTLEPVESQSC